MITIVRPRLQRRRARTSRRAWTTSSPSRSPARWPARSQARRPVRSLRELRLPLQLHQLHFRQRAAPPPWTGILPPRCPPPPWWRPRTGRSSSSRRTLSRRRRSRPGSSRRTWSRRRTRSRWRRRRWRRPQVDLGSPAFDQTHLTKTQRPLPGILLVSIPVLTGV